MPSIERRSFIKNGAFGIVSLAMLPGLSGYKTMLDPATKAQFRISSLNGAFIGRCEIKPWTILILPV